MADCFSLPNVAEKISLSMNAGARAIEQNKKLHGVYYCIDPLGETKEIAYLEAATVLRQNADAIEQLLSKTEQLKAERDAAVALLKEESYCYSCKQCTERDGNECWCAALGDWSEWYDGCDAWEWRGVPEADHFRDATKMVDEEPCEACSLDDLWEQIEKKNGGC